MIRRVKPERMLFGTLVSTHRVTARGHAFPDHALRKRLVAVAVPILSVGDARKRDGTHAPARRIAFHTLGASFYPRGGVRGSAANKQKERRIAPAPALSMQCARSEDRRERPVQRTGNHHGRRE